MVAANPVPKPKVGLVEHMWKYPLFATCRYCGELLQFDVDPRRHARHERRLGHRKCQRR
jgi:hypothetical protein